MHACNEEKLEYGGDEGQQTRRPGGHAYEPVVALVWVHSTWNLRSSARSLVLHRPPGGLGTWSTNGVLWIVTT
ncbi:unnamed protein product [Mesocestoides corti]|nr:unnamed protein product [Mesocestoides corti]